MKADLEDIEEWDGKWPELIKDRKDRGNTACGNLWAAGALDTEMWLCL